jgi:hypothetical protein
LCAVVNITAVLSSPLRRAGYRPITKNRVSLSGSSSMFSNSTLSPCYCPASFDPIAATSGCCAAISAALLVLAAGWTSRSFPIAESHLRHWLNTSGLE